MTWSNRSSSAWRSRDLRRALDLLVKFRDHPLPDGALIVRDGSVLVPALLLLSRIFSQAAANRLRHREVFDPGLVTWTVPSQLRQRPTSRSPPCLHPAAAQLSGRVDSIPIRCAGHEVEIEILPR